jgi:proteasome beta subunit
MRNSSSKRGSDRIRLGDAGALPQDPYAPRFASPPPAGDQPSEDELLETGTTIVGLTAADSVVMASDKRASIGGLVSSKTAQKLEQIHLTAALAISGGVSAAQALVANLRTETSLYETRRDKRMSMQALSTLTGNLLRSGGFYIVTPILGGVDAEGAHIYDVDPAGGVSSETYAAGGSGTPLAYGVLEQEYEADLSVDEATDIASRAIQGAIERDLASGNGLWMSIITEDGVDIRDYDEPEAALG